MPRRVPLAYSEFATLRQSLLKIGARVVEKAARIRIHLGIGLPQRRPIPHASRATRDLGT